MNLEELFIREFKKSMRSLPKTRDIYKVPLPAEVSEWSVSDGSLYGVYGIPFEEGGIFRGLNRTFVRKPPSGVVVKKRKVDLVNRCFMKDSSGGFVYEDVRVPRGSMVVISKTNLNILFGYRDYSDGFGYIDFIDSGKGGREFIYYIPKRYLYSANETALAISVKDMKNYYGRGYLTWDYGLIYIHVIPYRAGRKYIGTRVLKSDCKLNYDCEIRALVDFWVKGGIIPAISLCNTVSEGNLVLKETVRGYNDFEPLEKVSVADREILGEGGSK